MVGVAKFENGNVIGGSECYSAMWLVNIYKMLGFCICIISFSIIFENQVYKKEIDINVQIQYFLESLHYISFSFS